MAQPCPMQYSIYSIFRLPRLTGEERGLLKMQALVYTMVIYIMSEEENIYFTCLSCCQILSLGNNKQTYAYCVDIL